VVCGGTGLYLAALAGALDPIDERYAAGERAAARARVAEIPAAERHAALLELDPESARRLKAGDLQRVERALEVHFLTGRPISELQRGGATRAEHLALRLVRPRAELHRRIQDRLEAMLEAGLEEEARRLYEAGWSPKDPGVDTIGYREWWSYFEGRGTRRSAVHRILTATRAYAKRQETWFRHQGDYRAQPPDPGAVIDAWRLYLGRRAS
jgi:tRNA dimethylallyltransferase